MCKEVVEFVKQQNIEAKERMAKDCNLHCSMWTEDAEHWAEFKTLEEWKRSMAIEHYINAYKGWHGIKPRWEDFKFDGRDLTSEEINTMTRTLCEQESVFEDELQARLEKERKEAAAARGAAKRACYPTLGSVFADAFKEMQ